MTERYERQTAGRARDTLPAGYVIIRDGEVRPDDLIYSWTSNEWLRADDPGWLRAAPIAVADCTAVAREAKFSEHEFANAPRRSYHLPRAIATPDPALPAAPSAEQRSLF